jgi:hypothetical protein
MDAFTRPFEPLVMQNGIHRFGGRARAALRSRPGIAKSLDGLAPAVKAGTMTCRQRDGLIEKEQLRPASPGHDHPAAALVLAAADEPGLGGPASLQQGPCRGIVDDAAVAGERAALGDGDNLAEGCDAVLKRHRRSAGARGGDALRSRLPGDFPVEQCALALDTSSISRKRSVMPDHAVAWNGDGEIICRAGPCDPAHRSRGSYASRDLSIGERLADRNLPQRLPHATLTESIESCPRDLLAAGSTSSPAGTSLPEHRGAERVGIGVAVGRRLGSNLAYPVDCQSNASVIMDEGGSPRLSDDASSVSAGFPG